jgi:hypothetical protein
MTLDELTVEVLRATEATGVPFMVVGALAAGAYGVPRSTRDLDLLVSVEVEGSRQALLGALEHLLEFDAQPQFDTLTWGTRVVGTTKSEPRLNVEFFELFDDPFVQEEFRRRRRVSLPGLGLHTWLPTAEDVVVQKLRWGRPKDLDDARDVLAVQGTDSLDMSYIRRWCEAHGTADRLRTALSGIPPGG